VRHGRRHPSGESLNKRQTRFNAMRLGSFHVACPKATSMPEL
jgi:hypothetical protein